jgi:hypothetical protein
MDPKEHHAFEPIGAEDADTGEYVPVNAEILHRAMSKAIVIDGGGYVKIRDSLVQPGELILNAAVRLVFDAIQEQQRETEA